MKGSDGPAHVTAPVSAVSDRLPGWATLIRASNPGPMTLDGTNTWVLRGRDGSAAVVVDPGPDDADHRDAIAAHGPVGLVLVTHGHPDHVEGARALADRLGGIPVAAADPRHCVRAGPLRGSRVDGPAVDRAGLAITVILAPGHTADSVCFLVGADRERAMLTGDTILGRGTTVVAWPDGDLGRYLSSLELLSAYDGVPVLPGHGPALDDCGAAARFYLAHRRARLDQVRAVVAAGAVTPAAVVERVYADVDRSLRPAAEWSVRAQLAYLEGERESPPGPARLDSP